MIELIPYSSIYEKDTLRRISEFFDFHHALTYGDDQDIEKANQQKVDIRDTLIDWVTHPSALYVIMERDVSVGFVRICYRGPNVAWIEDIFVDVVRRGNGVATEAIHAVENVVKSVQGYTAICIDVSPRNANALRLYHKLGYTDLSLITIRKEFGESERSEPMDLCGFNFHC